MVGGSGRGRLRPSGPVVGAGAHLPGQPGVSATAIKPGGSKSSQLPRMVCSSALPEARPPPAFATQTSVHPSTVLIFSDAQFAKDDEGHAKVEAAIRDIQANYSWLTEVALTEVGVTDDGAIALAEALDSNTHLRKLALYGNEIGDAGVGFNDRQVGLASVLHKNSTLTALGLSHNHITEDGFGVFVDVLEKNNRTLQLLNLAANDIDNGMVKEEDDAREIPEETMEKFLRIKALENRLNTNRTLKHFNVSENQITPAIVARMGR